MKVVLPKVDIEHDSSVSGCFKASPDGTKRGGMALNERAKADDVCRRKVRFERIVPFEMVIGDIGENVIFGLPVRIHRDTDGTGRVGWIDLDKVNEQAFVGYVAQQILAGVIVANATHNRAVSSQLTAVKGEIERCSAQLTTAWKFIPKNLAQADYFTWAGRIQPNRHLSFTSLLISFSKARRRIVSFYLHVSG
jgi:hypothetical protein